MAGGGILLIFFLILGTFATSLWYIFMNNPSPNTSEELNSAVRSISMINGALILLLLFFSMLYTQANPVTEKRYVFILLHVTLFLSLLSVSVSVLTKRQ